MGKRRIHNKHLPQRVYFKHGAYYHVSTDGKWTRLGTTESQMFRALSDRVAEDYPKERLTSVYWGDYVLFRIAEAIDVKHEVA